MQEYLLPSSHVLLLSLPHHIHRRMLDTMKWSAVSLAGRGEWKRAENYQFFSHEHTNLGKIQGTKCLHRLPDPKGNVKNLWSDPIGRLHEMVVHLIRLSSKLTSVLGHFYRAEYTLHFLHFATLFVPNATLRKGAEWKCVIANKFPGMDVK